jgi:hypothetical protein
VVSLAVALVPGKRRTACPGVPTCTWKVDHLPSIPSQYKLGGTFRGGGREPMDAICVANRNRIEQDTSELEQMREDRSLQPKVTRTSNEL